MKALLCELLLACLATLPGARSADELAYGSMLFAYYQEDYSQALLEVMVAEARGQTGDDPTRLTLAKGSFAFVIGLYGLSADTFADLEPQALDDLDRMRLAFHRARLHHRAGAWPEMERELDRISLGRTWFGRAQHHPEIGFMRAEAALARADFPAAQQALAPLSRDEAYLGYGLFNLAVAQRQAGDRGAAQATLERLSRLPLRGDQGYDLTDRGRLALAVLSAEAGATMTAEAVLSRLPASGRYREQALAVYADLAMARGDHRLAARIWLSLLEGDDWHTGRAAAELGLPMALEAMAAPERALEGYRRAAATFANRISALDSLTALANGDDWGARLLRGHAEQGVGFLDTLHGAGRSAFGTQDWLNWLAREDVSALIAEWQTLRDMQAWLQALPEDLVALEEVKQERLRRAALARSQLDADALAQRGALLGATAIEQGATLTAMADPARPLDDALLLALANPAERRRLERLQGLQARLADQTGQPRHAELSRRIERLRGVVAWEISEARSQRVRDLVRGLEQTREVAADADRRMARLVRAEADLAVGVAVDFAAVSARAAALSSAVAMAQGDRERAVAAAFRDALERERLVTEQRLLTARIAVARTTDLLAAGSNPPAPGT